MFKLEDYFDTDEIKKIKRVTKWVAAGLVGATALWTSLYSIPTDSVAVVQRFGKYARTENPGLKLKAPFGIEKRTIVPVQKIQTVEFGFRTKQENNQRTYDSGKQFQQEYLMLTGDLNMVDVESSIQFQISDPKAFLFNVKNPEALVRDVYNSIIREQVGNGSVDEVIMTLRSEYAAQTKTKLQKTLDEYHSGIHINTVNLQSTNPPESVRQAFNAVNAALQEKETKINEANREYNKAVPMANGTAEMTVNQANGYALETVNRAKGDVAQFSQVYNAYKASPEVTAQRMYFDSMSGLMGRLPVTIIEQKGLENGLLLRKELDSDKNPGAAK